MFNLQGEVIGVNTAIFSPSGGSVGIGFAIPSNLAKTVIQQIIEYGRTRRGWLGVRIQTVTDEIADSLGLKETRGALVASVTKGGPAEKAGFEAGDIIVSFNGKDIKEMRELPRIVAETNIDDKVVVKFWRDEKLRTARVKVGELEKAEEDGLIANNTTKKTTPKQNTTIDKVGMSLSSLTNNAREEFGIPDDVQGVLVSNVKPRGEADNKGIAAGDVIVEINQKTIEDPEDFRKAIKKAIKNKRSSVLLLINRSGDVRFTALRLDKK